MENSIINKKLFDKLFFVGVGFIVGALFTVFETKKIRNDGEYNPGWIYQTPNPYVLHVDTNQLTDKNVYIWQPPEDGRNGKYVRKDVLKKEMRKELDGKLEKEMLDIEDPNYFRSFK